MATLIQFLQYTLASKGSLLANETKRIMLKEALQAYVLDFLYNHPLYRRLNFYGGTCLHVIYNLNRISEDLDLYNSIRINLSHLADELVGYFHKTLGYLEVTSKTQEGEAGILRITLKFPLLSALGLSDRQDEMLHMKVEVSQHKQVSVIKQTPILYFGRSFVPSHFSLETMMAGKMLACLERNLQKGNTGTMIKGRDFYDLLWFMQREVRPLEEKLAEDGSQPYTIQSAMTVLKEKVKAIKPGDLAIDLYPMFEQRTFIVAWVNSFQSNFMEYLQQYI